jgi:hypothetical protein
LVFAHTVKVLERLYSTIASFQLIANLLSM